MSRDAYSRNKVLTKEEFDRQTPVPILWNDDRIPPLVTLSNQKTRDIAEKIQLQSLNQSDVKSVYTIDRQEFGKNVLEMMNSSSESNKDNRTERINIQPAVHTQSKPNLKEEWETSTKQRKLKREPQNNPRDYFTAFREEQTTYKEDKKIHRQDQKAYNQCPAVKLYSQLVGDKLKLSESQQGLRTGAGQFEFDWMRDKKASELLANVLTNPNRLNLYIHYLLHEIYLNEQAKVMNDLHQEEVRPYNPNLKQYYENILCLLSKVNKMSTQNKMGFRVGERSRQKKGVREPQQENPKISLFQNGVNIDLNPRMSEIKRQKASRIRNLKMQISEKEQQFQEMKKYYEQIIMNYAVAIENLNKEESSEGLLKPPAQGIQQSVVKLVVEEEQEEEGIRNKHHTFGMGHYSGRSSRDMKPREK